MKINWKLHGITTAIFGGFILSMLLILVIPLWFVIGLIGLVEFSLVYCLIYFIVENENRF